MEREEGARRVVDHDPETAHALTDTLLYQMPAGRIPQAFPAYSESKPSLR